MTVVENNIINIEAEKSEIFSYIKSCIIPCSVSYCKSLILERIVSYINCQVFINTPNKVKNRFKVDVVNTCQNINSVIINITDLFSLEELEANHLFETFFHINNSDTINNGNYINNRRKICLFPPIINYDTDPSSTAWVADWISEYCSRYHWSGTCWIERTYDKKRVYYVWYIAWGFH